MRPRTLLEEFSTAAMMEEKVYIKAPRYHGALQIGEGPGWLHRAMLDLVIPFGDKRGSRYPSASLTDFEGRQKSFGGANEGLTPTQVEERRAKGLCFYYSEKFAHHHHCPSSSSPPPPPSPFLPPSPSTIIHPNQGLHSLVADRP